MDKAINRWVKISLINLLIVSLLGVILRYKIAFSLPFVDQKFMLHAHSHFAFAGWISQAIMALIVQYISKFKPGAFKSYNAVLTGNLLTAYGMLFSFPLQGYGLFSIIFSTLNIFVAYWFGIKTWKDLKTAPTTIKQWLRAAAAFNAISSIGAFTLAYLMASETVNGQLYLAAIYFYLHFQYNGWFFFGCMGIFTPYLITAGIPAFKIRISFILLFISCFPTYFLSASWIQVPLLVQLIVTVSAFAQVAAFIILAGPYIKYKRLPEKKEGRVLLLLAGIALAIKFLLQLASTVPSLSIYIFGFRPIIIGYLHLVLLGVITLFIIGYLLNNSLLYENKLVMTGIKLFTIGIILNEAFLMVQGIGALGYSSIPRIEIYLFGAGIFMLLSLVILNIGLLKAKRLKPG